MESYIPKALGWPEPGHEAHLCYLENLGILEKDPECYKGLVRNAKFICMKCGRVAEKAENLCEPEAL